LIGPSSLCLIPEVGLLLLGANIQVKQRLLSLRLEELSDFNRIVLILEFLGKLQLDFSFIQIRQDDRLLVVVPHDGDVSKIDDVPVADYFREDDIDIHRDPQGFAASHVDEDAAIDPLGLVADHCVVDLLLLLAVEQDQLFVEADDVAQLAANLDLEDRFDLGVVLEVEFAGKGSGDQMARMHDFALLEGDLGIVDSPRALYGILSASHHFYHQFISISAFSSQLLSLAGTISDLHLQLATRSKGKKI
jgi:hypothetical protein